MNISDIIVKMAQASEIEQPSLFPFPFKIHVTFACIALVFFVIQFLREKKPYQLIMGIAIPLSLLIRLSDNKVVFYIIGIIEAILLLAAFITSIIFKQKEVPSEKAEKSITDEEFGEIPVIEPKNSNNIQNINETDE